MSQIDEFLESNLDHYIAELVELCAQRSISARMEGTQECAELVGRLLARHGLSVTRFESAFPPGIPIGSVTRVEDAGTDTQQIHVKPFADLQRLEFVQVLTQRVNGNRR